MVWEDLSLEALRGELAHIAEVYHWERHQTQRNLFLAVQKGVGDLGDAARWDERPAAEWGDGERNEVEDELGNIIAYTVRLADRCGIDLARVMNRKLHRSPGQQQRPQRPQQQQQQAQQASQPQQQSQQPQPQPQPRQAREVQSSRQTTQPQSLSPGQPSPQGADARGSSSARQQQPHGLTSPQQKSPPSKSSARPQPLDADSLRKHETASKQPPFKIKRTLSVVCQNNCQKLYSPTHFDHGLFSPVTDKTDFDVEYNTQKPPLPVSLSKQNLEEASADPPRAPSPVSPQSLTEFSSALDLLPTLPEKDLLSLNLTFVGPLDGSGEDLVPLVQNGDQILVTPELLPEFCRLGKQLAAEGVSFVPQPLKVPRREEADGPFAATATAIAAAKPRNAPAGAAAGGGAAAGTSSPAEKKRQLSRTLSVQVTKPDAWDAKRDVQTTFSPTHFDLGLFSPTTDKTEFEVEYSQEGARTTLPASLSKGKLTQPKNGPAAEAVQPENDTAKPEQPSMSSEMRRLSVASLCSDDDEEYRGLDLLAEVSEEDQDKLRHLKKNLRALSPRSNDLETNFLPMIHDLELMQADRDITEAELQSLELHFCMPANGVLYDLVPNGRDIAVTLDLLPEFIRLTKQKKDELFAELYEQAETKPLQEASSANSN